MAASGSSTGKHNRGARRRTLAQGYSFTPVGRQSRCRGRPEASQATEAIAESLREADPSTLASLVERVRLERTTVSTWLEPGVLAQLLGLEPGLLDTDLLTIGSPFTLRRRGVEARIIAGSIAPAADPHLRKTLIEAHRWLGELKANRSIAEIAQKAGHSKSYIRTRLPLALLSPRIQHAVLDGTIDPSITVDSLLKADLPNDWRAQEAHLGLPAT